MERQRRIKGENEFIELYNNIDILDNREANNIERILEKQVDYFSLGSNTLKIERTLRRHKAELEYKEPKELNPKLNPSVWNSDKAKIRGVGRHKFTSEEARAAAKKRWDKYKAKNMSSE